LARNNEEQEGALQVRQNEVENLERKIASVRDPVALETAIARYQSQCVELEALRQEEEEEFTAEREAITEEIAAALHSCGEYMTHVKTRLEDFQDSLQIKRETIGTIEDNVGM